MAYHLGPLWAQKKTHFLCRPINLTSVYSQEPNHCPTYRCGPSLPDSHVLELTWCLSKFIYFHTCKTASLDTSHIYLVTWISIQIKRQRTKMLNPGAFALPDSKRLLFFSARETLDRPVYLFPRFSVLFGCVIRCFTSVRNLRKDASCVHWGRTSCLYAGGTLATRLNSNYACMGLPPDDMIGF